jgi:hypothetical protein
MSRTVRRKKFNRKNHFYQHYWECFSEKEVKESNRITLWQYHGDNYYTKSCKDNKQFLKNLEDRMLRQDFKQKLFHCDIEEIVLNTIKPRSIKWRLH